MKKLLINEINLLKNSPIISQEVFKEFLEKLNSFDPLLRDENPTSHICACYLPVNLKNKKVYLVIHSKSGLWMPPGGHIDKNELPIDTIKRECQEELNYTITNELIQLYTISIENIDNPKHNCKKHFSFWYLVNMDEVPFEYNKKESSDGRWVSLDEAQQLVTFYSYIKPLASLATYLKL